MHPTPTEGSPKLAVCAEGGELGELGAGGLAGEDGGLTVLEGADGRWSR